jgi:pimeloyl-ACP methyl ester carboxylesterase
MLNDLHRRYVNGELSRRGFIRGAAAAIAAGASVPAWMLGSPAHAAAAQTGGTAAAALPPLDLAEWSYFFVGVERIEMARGSFVNGKQMYVESFVPAQVRHPYPLVLVHGGGGQGLDWMGTPDGRRGWTQILLEEGYKVYVVDRPGHGRSPFHPDVDGPFPAQNLPLEQMSGQFTPPNAARPAPNELRKLHNQWPGTGELGSRDLDQLVASQGGSYVQAGGGFGAPPAAAAAGGGRGGAGGGPGAGAGRGAGAAGGQGAGPGAGPAFGRGGPPAIAAAPAVLGATGMPAGGPDSQHMVWRQRGALLLDKIGPAIIMTHSAGGPFGWLVAEIRPNLVKGIVAIEGGGQPFGGGNVWGMSSIPVAYDPVVSDASEIKTKRVDSGEPGVNAYLLQEEPARKLKNLQNIPIVIVTAEASFASPGNPGGVAYFKQAGCKAEELRLTGLGIHGNGHMMMVEKNNREVLKPILAWIDKNVNGSAKGANPKPAPKKEDSTAMKLADTGYFWVGTEHKKMPYGTIITGQMFVQYFTPAEVRHPYPVVLVHGGGGTALHYMGVGEKAGWAHYYVQEGYRVYLVDRPGHGRAPYHPDALGPIGGNVSYAAIAGDTRRAAVGPNHQWPGTGDIGDPLLDQMLAGQNAAPQDNVFAHTLWASRGAELLERIGPAIIQVHSAGGPFSWIVANERPNLVKAIINVEGGGQPFAAGTPWGLTDVPVVYDPPASDPSQIVTRDVAGPGGTTYKLQAEPARKLKNLQNIPTIYVVAEKSGRNGAPVVAYLKQAGVDAEEFNLKDKGVLGNGHFMMLENNRRQVFDAIRGWLEQKIPTRT